MIVFAIIVGILVFLFGLILLLPSQIGIEYENSDGKQRLILHIRLIGIPLKINIPVIKDAEKKKGKTKKVKKSEKTDTPKDSKEKKTFSNFRQTAVNMKDAYNEAKDDMKDILSQIRQRTKFDTITFCLSFGLSDAAKTGIATGAAWASSSCILSVLDHMFDIKKIYLDVSPDFNREHFHLYIKSILRLRLVHIINISIRIIKIVNLFIKKMDIK